MKTWKLALGAVGVVGGVATIVSAGSRRPRVQHTPDGLWMEVRGGVRQDGVCQHFEVVNRGAFREFLDGLAEENPHTNPWDRLAWAMKRLYPSCEWPPGDAVTFGAQRWTWNQARAAGQLPLAPGAPPRSGPKGPSGMSVGRASIPTVERLSRPFGRKPRAPSKTPDVVYVPSAPPVVEQMLSLAGISSDDLVYDLGCGDGRILAAAAQRYGARGMGWDIDPARVEEARLNVQAAGVEKLVSIVEGDAFGVDLEDASVIALYLLPDLNARLLPKLLRLRPGVRIVTHNYPLEGVLETTRRDIEGVVYQPTGNAYTHNVYLYETPLALRGEAVA